MHHNCWQNNFFQEKSDSKNLFNVGVNTKWKLNFWIVKCRQEPDFPPPSPGLELAFNKILKNLKFL